MVLISNMGSYIHMYMYIYEGGSKRKWKHSRVLEILEGERIRIYIHMIQRMKLKYYYKNKLKYTMNVGIDIEYKIGLF